MKRILVIDDDAALRDLVETALRERGYEVLTAAGGEKGVAKAARELPDLVLCDVNMEPFDGYATLAALRREKATATIPFILMTGRADQVGMRQGMELGANDYLPKPFTLEALYAAVATRLKMAEQLREQAGEALHDLRNNISMMLPHEFRTPLNGIIGYGEVLAANPAEDIAEMGQTIVQSAAVLERLVETFLAYSQLEILRANKKETELLRKQSCAGDLLTGQEARRQAAAVERAGDLELAVAPVRPAISDDYFTKLVGEILHNAFRFSAPGKPVHVSLAASGGLAVLRVQDQGRGMSGDQVARIGAFMQFDRKTHEQQGLGLGLTIARRIAELHEGVLLVQSESGTGTTVTVKLPLAA
ncbi:MAG TPA: hybrid sensor histidine kinase/response regulator [Verrucomicrobiota bacterium]|nr:hybrid sensor histidine kinase/response regulator [Verrucomicrobiota bacterium]HNT15218.1 hybrid sensor histidine kinase/response regulator [Verrucomicrobiota bacterium]